MVRLILAAQADPKRQWSWQWQTIFEDMHQKQMVSEVDWQSYWRQAYSLAIQVSERNNLLLISISRSPQPRASRFSFETTIDLESVRLGKTRLFPPPFHFEGLELTQLPIQLPLPPLEELQDGPQIIDAVVVLHFVRSMFIEEQAPNVSIPLKTTFTLQPREH